MGVAVSNIMRKLDSMVHHMRGVKRTASEAKIEFCDDEADMNTPRKKKLKTTADYIFEKLFQNGEGSDVKIYALNHEWNLHKVYLCQSKYFESMFSGDWREGDMKIVRIGIPNDLIDEEALDIVLGSLYRGDVTITPCKAVKVLAAASLLCLDELADQAAAIMTDSINCTTVSKYYTASVDYGQPAISAKCVRFLETTLMNTQSVDLLRDISIDLMEKVLHSQNLFVTQVEMDVYTLMRKWLFLKLCPEWTGEYKALTQAAEEFIKQKSEEWVEPFLDQAEGLTYHNAFSALRIRHIIVDHSAVILLENDNIIPKQWLKGAYRDQWLTLLKIDQGLDKGPDKTNISEEDFLRSSMRCGRVLHHDQEYIWRWTGFNFGLDIIVSCKNRVITFKRNTQSTLKCVSLKAIRKILYRLSIVSLNKSQKEVYSKTTGYQILSMQKDQETMVLLLDGKVTFPLLIGCNFLVNSFIVKAKDNPKVKDNPVSPSEQKPTTFSSTVDKNISASPRMRSR